MDIYIYPYIHIYIYVNDMCTYYNMIYVLLKREMMLGNNFFYADSQEAEVLEFYTIK